MKPVPIVNDTDLAALLKACSAKEFKDRRDEALLRLLLDCGLRVSEACGLRVDQLDLGTGISTLTGGILGSQPDDRRQSHFYPSPRCSDTKPSGCGEPRGYVNL
jgi:integrase